MRHIGAGLRKVLPVNGDEQQERITAFAALGGPLTRDEIMRLPLRVTGVVIFRQARAGCISGRISTNGSAGTLLYQWAFRPGLRAPEPLSQPVAAGQRVVSVTVPVEGNSRVVTLEVLSPDVVTASTAVS